jgi:hypothetical protein
MLVVPGSCQNYQNRAASSKQTDVGRGESEWGVTVNLLMEVDVPYSIHSIESNSVSTLYNYTHTVYTVRTR